MKTVLFALLALVAWAASASPRKAPAIDLGRLGGQERVSATVALQLRNQDFLETEVNRIYDRSSPAYHQFLTADQFRTRYAPTAATVARVTQHFASLGLNVQAINGGYLHVSGASADVERAFNVQMHSFKAGDSTFHAPVGNVQVHPSIATDVLAVVGLNSQSHLHTNIRRLPEGLSSRSLTPRTSSAAPNTPDPPGLWTVIDFADYYDINPLYAKGITGKGRTIGIVTLAAFTPSDAFAYWNSLGLTTDPNRITIVNIDGGPGAPSDASGSDETTLDVQQSGGIAPGAKIIVYQAPNTDQAFVDAFAQAVGDNKADVISCSWGEWEGFLVQGLPVTDTNSAGDIQAMHFLFIQAALQGQSLSAAAGDSGSDDVNRALPPPFFSVVVSVDHPAADPFMTAAGGTTLPGPQVFQLGDGSLVTINIPKERAWSWDYLTGLCAQLGFDPISCGIFPVGGGGGVSVVFPRPIWQDFISGVRNSEPNQVLVDETTTPPTTLVKLPSRFPGRNLPDISLNSDPDTGYIIPYTSSRRGFEVLEFIGGTSFAAPQLAGISALIDQDAHGRIGLLSLSLYELALFHQAYTGRHPPIRDIRDGNNEFYNATPGYDQASGLGVLDVANLAALFH